ncbi:MAG TPA: HAD family hydrolase [Acidimicrobiales bacterium]|nr:HAD family hydrolase [Acidimicrobiales bacterium]
MGDGRVLEAVFVDFGGTLMPNALPMTAELEQWRARSLSGVLGPDPAKAAAVIEAIETAALAAPVDRPDEVIVETLVRHGFRPDEVTVRRVRQALSVPLAGALSPFPDAGDLLAGIKQLGLGCVIVSNTTFRDAATYGRDFEALGWAASIDGCVTSVDAGCRKPDHRIFELALEAVGSRPGRCVMVGDSEDADISPAVGLGMRAILVSIERRPPRVTAADVCVTALEQALDVLKEWVRFDRRNLEAAP